jgi:hypothetical protein
MIERFKDFAIIEQFDPKILEFGPGASGFIFEFILIHQYLNSRKDAMEQSFASLIFWNTDGRNT